MNYERFAAHLAAALGEFGNIEEDKLPGNAITLWRQIVAGVERVQDRLTAPPPELRFAAFTWRSIGSAPRDRPILVGGRREDGTAWWRHLEEYDPSSWVDQPPYWTDCPEPPRE